MRHRALILLLLAAATIAVFWRVGRHEFVNYDDYAYVTMNPMVQQGITWPGVVWAFTELHGEATYWHPLTWLSHMLDCRLYGVKPAGHHWSNLFFHTLNVLLLFVLLERMTGRRWPSAFVAALFALHPLQVDSVAWIAERKNLLSTLFWLLTLLAYVRYAARPNWSRYIPVFLCMALGLMAKPTLVVMPFILLLLDFWPLKRWQLFESTSGDTRTSLQLLLLEKIPLLALSVASSIITVRAHQQLGALVDTAELPIHWRLMNAFVSYALYLRKVIWPADLSVFYMHPGRWPVIIVIVSVLVVLGITALVMQQARRRPYLLVGWLWFLGALAPTIGLIQAHVQAMADRFAYVPVIGLFVMIVWATDDLIQRAPRWRKIALSFQALALCACIAISSFQLRHWQNSVTLLQHAVKTAGGNPLIHVMLGNALFERRNFPEAFAEYNAALRLRRDDANAWQRAGVALVVQGRAAEAIPYFNSAIQLAPNLPEPRRHLALALLRLGRVQEARTVYQNLAPLFPATADAQRTLADILAEGEQFGDAIKHYREALRLKPNFEVALNNLAWLRATCAQPELRDGREAVQLAERACELSRRRNPSFLGTLAAAYAEAGRFNEAVKTIQEAQSKARTTGAKEVQAIQQQMLELFRAGRPFHLGA